MKKMEMVDSLNDINEKIRFMAEACSLIALQEDAITEEIAVGMLKIFYDINQKLTDVTHEIHETATIRSIIR